MTVLIVTESIFGNTLAIAEAIGGGVAEVLGRQEVRVVHASAAPTHLPDEVDLLVVGAPTHTLAMPDAGSRAAAAAEVASSAVATRSDPLPAASIELQPTGVREWIASIDPPEHVRVATFDTSIPAERQLGTAARAAAVALRKRGIATTIGPSFDVTGMEGPLADGELGRATAWGRELAAAC